MKWLEAKIAFKQLHNTSSFIPFTVWITLLGLSIGVMSLIVVVSVMNGFETELQKNIMSTESHVILYRQTKGIGNWKSLQERIEKIDPLIIGALPVTYNEVLFVHDGRVQGGVLEGVLPESAHLIDALAGKDFTLPGAYVGKELALKLNLKKGQRLKVLLTQPGSNVAPTLFEMPVSGIFDAGLYEYSSRYVYVNMAFAQKHLDWGNRISAFKIKIKDPYQAKQIGRKIRKSLSFPFFIRTWSDMNKNIFAALKIEKVVMGIVLACIIAVALFNVMSSLIMIVIEKTKEISILKAMGMRSMNIARIFLWQGLYMGMLGTAIGSLMGWVVCFLLDRYQFIPLSGEVYYISHLPVEMRWVEVALIAVAMLLVSFGASFLPALRAAKMLPVEGLRYE